MQEQKIDKPLIELAITSLEPQGNPDSKTFRVPAGASRWADCSSELMLGKLLERPTPSYPTKEKEKGLGGEVIAYAIVGTDGRLHQVTPIKAPISAITTSTLNALRRWRYEPASCDGVPVPVVTFVTATFTLNY